MNRVSTNKEIWALYISRKLSGGKNSFRCLLQREGGGMQVLEMSKVLGSLIVKVQYKSMQFLLFGELVLFEQMWKCHQWWFSSIAFVRLRTKRYSVDYFLHLEQQHFSLKIP